MEPARITLDYKNVQIVCARLKGSYIGEVRLYGDPLFKSTAKSYELLQQQLKDWIDQRPELALISAPIVETYRGIGIKFVELGGVVWGLGELRSYPLFKCTGATPEEAVAQIKSKVDDNQQLVAKTISERHRNTLKEYGVPWFESISTKPASQNRYRSAHCWACHHPIDNDSHQECTGCGWIICLCGACGCSYEQYKRQLAR